MNRIAAWQGGGLVMDSDLSRQLVVSPELQALVREAGLPVELQFDWSCQRLLREDWRRLDIPVRQTHI